MRTANDNGWTKRTRGNAKVYTHPSLTRAVVVNHYGIAFNGVVYPSLEEAMRAALEKAA